MASPHAGRHYPRSVGEFQAWFGTDANCLDYLEWMRWPEGFVCPSCGHEGGWRLGDGRFWCPSCGRRTSVTPENGYAWRQVKELEQLARALRALPPDDLLVVAGDFNVPASNPIFSTFLTSAGLVSAVDWSLFPDSRGSLAIDNILYRPPSGRPAMATARLRFEESIRLASGRSTFPSDHVGVEAQLDW